MDAAHPSVKPAERIGRSLPGSPIRSPRPLVPGKPSEPTADPELEPTIPRLATRWVPLVPGARSFPVGLSARSGAMMMVATRADPQSREPGPTPTEIGVRTALVSCVEALLPALEPGWSDCTEHPSCRAVQEAAAVLWGTARKGPEASPGTESEPR